MRQSPTGLPAIDTAAAHRRLPQPNPAVVYCEVEEGAVLLSTTEEAYYGLNPVGARIWSLLTPPPQTLESVCAALAVYYPEVDLLQLQNDVLKLLDELTRHGLVVMV